MLYTAIALYGRFKLSRTKNKTDLKKHSNNRINDVAYNPHLALPPKAFNKLYSKVLAAPDNNTYTVVYINILDGGKLGII